MSGIIPPSILTLQYEVDTNFKKYVNLSLPFRAKIENIWFTADDGLSGRGYGNDEGNNPWSLERVLRLGAVKQRNALRHPSTGDSPSDVNMVWADEFNWYGPVNSLVPNDKPSIWFGNPDYRDDVEDENSETPEQQVQYDDFWGTTTVYRSTARPMPTLDNMSYWFNWGWDETETNANKYKTDLSILNTDEFLSLFVYSDGGNWDDYVQKSGIATIYVQYSGIANGTPSNPIRSWDW